MHLHAATVGKLFPVPAVGGGWAQAALKTTELGVILEELLVAGGFNAEEVGMIGAHSLKATALSWLSKAGVPRDDRRTLGYHIKPGDCSLES